MGYRSCWPMAGAARSLIPSLFALSTPDFFMRTKKTNSRPLPGGRPPKLNKEQYGQVTCVLRLDTIERLKEGAGSKHFGEFLQEHLDRCPPPTREQYLSLSTGIPYYTTIKRKKVPTLYATLGNIYETSAESRKRAREARKLAREQARRAKLTPKERAWEDSITETVTKAVAEVYGNRS